MKRMIKASTNDAETRLIQAITKYCGNIISPFEYGYIDSNSENTAIYTSFDKIPDEDPEGIIGNPNNSYWNSHSNIASLINNKTKVVDYREDSSTLDIFTLKDQRLESCLRVNGLKITKFKVVSSYANKLYDLDLVLEVENI